MQRLKKERDIIILESVDILESLVITDSILASMMAGSLSDQIIDLFHLVILIDMSGLYKINGSPAFPH